MIPEPAKMYILTTADALMEFAEAYAKKKTIDKQMPAYSPEITRKIAIEIITAKGYHATSCQAFNKLVKHHGINGTQRGNFCWYKTKDIESIPPRT